MKELQLTAINIYPVKSLAGIPLGSSQVESRGLKFDRRWMLVDEENVFITQRKYPVLALLKTKLTETFLEVSNESYGTLRIYFEETSERSSEVIIWESTCQALEVSNKANEYFSGYLNKEVKMVYMPESSIRYVDQSYSINNEIVSFADAFPLLLIGEGSLNDLNSRLIDPVLMDRFRPNIVVNTSVPFEEDNWEEFSIGNANFRVVKPCSRCVMTTVDQKTGLKGPEPLRTLASYRSFDNKIWFGQNVLCLGGESQIKLKDTITIRSKRHF